MTDAIVVTGTDTGVGKTIFCAALTQAVGASYWKPIQAGYEDGGDRLGVLNLLGLPPERGLPEAYRLGTACSPHRAAEIDGIAIDPRKLELPRSERLIVVEGAGGVLCPISRTLLYADMFARWARPTALVARTSLGTINHSLMSIEALRARGVPILGVAFVGEANEDTEATIAQIGNVRRLGRLPWFPVLDRDALAAAFADSFNLSDFAR